MYNDGRINIIYANGNLIVQNTSSNYFFGKLNPLANEVFPLMVMSRKHSSLLKKTKRLIGIAMVAMLEING